MQKIFLTFFFISICFLNGNAAAEKPLQKLPEELIKVRKHILENDYPGIFDEKSYRVAINGFQVIDIGNDGLIEVVILFHPHFLQSPTIVIYRIQKDDSVKRIREALAPGPLVRRTDYFLDSHEIGLGVDFTLGKNEPLSFEEGKNIAKIAVE